MQMKVDANLLQEIQQEADCAKIIIKEQVELSVEELCKISLSDFSPNCPIRSFDKFIEECVLEFERRCKIVEANLERELEILIPKTKFFQYDVVIAIAEKTMFEIVLDNCPWFYHPIIQTKDIQTKVKEKILMPHRLFLFPTRAANQIKEICADVFRAAIKSKHDEIISFGMWNGTKRIDRILDYIKSEMN